MTNPLHHRTTAYQTTIHPDGWMPAQGYANGIVAQGKILTIAGQVGWDPATGDFGNRSFTEQVVQTLRNIVSVLEAGGAQPTHLVRLTWFITDKPAYLTSRREIGQAYREIIGRHFPPMSVVVVSELIEDQAKVEIEATAVIPG